MHSSEKKLAQKILKINKKPVDFHTIIEYLKESEGTKLNALMKGIWKACCGYETIIIDLSEAKKRLLQAYLESKEDNNYLPVAGIEKWSYEEAVLHGILDESLDGTKKLGNVYTEVTSKINLS